MRLRTFALAALAATGCSDAFTSQVEHVARVDQYELGVDRLAGILAAGKGFPLSREVVELSAIMWVDYTLFAHSLVSGDSLLDSATVMAAKWADVQQEIASSYHELLVGGAADFDSARVDSAYNVGAHRYIKQILFMAQANVSPEVREAKRRLAEETRSQLVSGMSWAEASQRTEEPDARPDGALGVIGRGQTVAAFENVAYALGPGEISAVTETAYGYHLIYRPELAEVFDEFKLGLQDRVEIDFEEEYLGELPDKWEIRVRASALPAVREVANDPVHAKESRTVVGSYRDGGKFRVSDVARWMQGMPPQVRQQLTVASDSQITLMVRSLIRNQVLLHEARDAGVAITPEVVASLTDGLARELALLGSLMGLQPDSIAMLLTLDPRGRRRAVEASVIGYFEAVSQNQRRLQLVPPYLADELRSRFEWEVIPIGVARVLERAKELRATLDSTALVPPPPGSPRADTLEERQ